MTPLVPIAMFGIIVLALRLFDKYPARTAAAAVFVIGWLFLPQAKYDIPVLPDYAKSNAMGLAVLVGILAKDAASLRRFKFSWMDLPMLCWCSAPFFSSVTNGLGAWDGASASLAVVVGWGLPYLIGRIYFGSLEGFRELAIGLFIGGLVIAPLAVLEMIISPQLHIWAYGWYPHDFSQTKRGGGYRPSVFMQHGLELAMWNAAAAFMGWQLFLRRTIQRQVPLLRLPLLPCVIGLTLVLVASRSSGALMLFVLAMVLFQASVVLRSKLPLLLLIILPVLYMNLRATGIWDGQNLIEAAGKVTRNEERVGSLSFRLFNEGLLVEKAREQLLFGWGGYNRSFVTNEAGVYISVPDGMWILTLGKNGLFGLTALTLSILLAPLLFFWRVGARSLADPLVAMPAAFATFLAIFMTDNLLNAMYNPIMMVAAGGLSSLLLGGRAPDFRDPRQAAEESPAVPAAVPTRVI